MYVCMYMCIRIKYSWLCSWLYPCIAHVLHIPEENFACASSKIMAHSVDCNKTENCEHIHTHILIRMPYSEVSVFDNREETGDVFISEGRSGGEVIVLGYHLDTCGGDKKTEVTLLMLPSC